MVNQWGRKTDEGLALAAVIKPYMEDSDLTQAELGKMVGFTREYIGSILSGRAGIISPEKFNKLHHILKFPANAALSAMGYDTETSADSKIMPALRLLLSDMDHDQQRAVLGVVRRMAKNGGDEAGSG